MKFRGVRYDYSGNSMINAPDLAIVGGIEKTIPLNHAGRLRLRADTQFQSAYHTAFIVFPFAYQTPVSKIDLLGAYEPSDWPSIEAFVRNIENSAVLTGGNSGITPTTPVGTGLENAAYLRRARQHQVVGWTGTVNGA